MKMTDIETAATIQELIRLKFPSVLVAPDMNKTPINTVFDVFFIADEQSGSYRQYLHDFLYEKLDALVFAHLTLLPHNISNTNGYYLENLRAHGYRDESEAPAAFVTADTAQ